MSAIKPITLIATIGSSPAVLTEAIYALKQENLWPVTEIEIITTSHGIKKIKENLYGTNGNLLALCKEIDIDPLSIKMPIVSEIQPVKDENGQPLDDIRNRKEDQALASHIQEIIRSHTSNPDKRVFSLLAGGRKTMSSHLMSAMQLFGRRDDRLLHLLVSEPYERIQGFYYPTQKSQMMELKSLKGELIGLYDSKEAKIDLIDIPYIRLRSYLSSHLDFSRSYGELMAEADAKLLSQEEYPVHDFHIHLDGANSRLCVNGAEFACKMEPRQLSILATYVWLNMEQGKPYDISWHDIVKEEERRNAMSVLYRTAVEGSYSGAAERERNISIKAFEENDEWRDYEYWHDDDDKPVRRSYSKQKSQLQTVLKNFLSENPALHLSVEHLWRESGHARKAVKKLNKVPVPVKKCRITGLHEKDAEMLGLDLEN